MAFRLYFDMSRTAVEILAIGLVAGVLMYTVNDMLNDEEKEIPEVNPIAG